MADEWYYTNQGQQLGPVSTEDLRRHAATGTLQPNDLVWQEGMPKWVSADSVGEFTFRGRQTGGGATRRAEADRAPNHYPDRDDDLDEEARPRRRRPERKGLSTGAKLGLGLGIGGGVLLLLIVVVVIIVVTVASRGNASTSGPKSWEHDFFPGEKQSYDVEFRGGSSAQFSIDGLDNTNVEIFVYDAVTNQLVTSSAGGFTDYRTVYWTPPTTRHYRIEVWNRDFVQPNLVNLWHN